MHVCHCHQLRLLLHHRHLCLQDHHPHLFELQVRIAKMIILFASMLKASCQRLKEYIACAECVNDDGVYRLRMSQLPRKKNPPSHPGAEGGVLAVARRCLRYSHLIHNVSTQYLLHLHRHSVASPWSRLSAGYTAATSLDAIRLGRSQHAPEDGAL